MELMAIFRHTFIIVLVSDVIFCEFFTALVDMEKLVHTEAYLIDSLQQYAQIQEEKLLILNRYIKNLQQQYEEAEKDVQTYLGNPINSYLLVKRLTTDWWHIQELSNLHLGTEILNNIMSNPEIKFPNLDDLHGAAMALTRLQETYDLDTTSLADGKINGIKYSVALDSDDCFEIGRQCLNSENYYLAALWLREAESKLKGFPNEAHKKAAILEYLSFSIYKNGNPLLALNLTNKLLEMFPDNKKALLNKAYIQEEISKFHLKTVSPDALNLSLIDKQRPKHNGTHFQYERFCKGEDTPPTEIISQLKCYYINNNTPFLKIAPFKVEEAFINPMILIFHDVLYDNEINTVKSLAKPRFARAMVQNPETGEHEFANYRISKAAWLKKQEFKAVAKIVQRTADMTRLNQQSAEDLQVVNYGIGGHYLPHYDCAMKNEVNAFWNLGTGNRIATVLFYMSDVAQGGATVFPYLHIAVRPKKGTAVFWYNLFPSGEGHMHTLHAACPVLVGSKWVSNIWIHEHHQEFIRPCDLQPAPKELTV